RTHPTRSPNFPYTTLFRSQQAIAVSNTAKTAQAITFTSTPPGGALPGGTYDVSATGGGSGNPVTFSIDSPSASACSIAGSTVTFTQARTSVLHSMPAREAH